MAIGVQHTIWVLGMGMILLSPVALAECRVNNAFNGASHYLVNGVWKTPSPQIVFKVSGESLGSGNVVWPSSLSNAGGNRTLSDHVRFRLVVKGKSSDALNMYFDSSAPLNCTNCAASVSIPMSKISWVESNSSETSGSTPGNGQLSNGLQSLIHAGLGTDNIFNLKFNFANDEIYPAGTYTGEFTSQGIPQ